MNHRCVSAHGMDGHVRDAGQEARHLTNSDEGMIEVAGVGNLGLWF